MDGWLPEETPLRMKARAVDPRPKRVGSSVDGMVGGGSGVGVGVDDDGDGDFGGEMVGGVVSEEVVCPTRGVDEDGADVVEEATKVGIADLVAGFLRLRR